MRELKNDLLESTNLVNDNKYRDSLDRGRKLLDDWLKTENTVLVTKK